MESYIFDIGNLVLCDFCNEEYTESNQTGGLIVAGNAICPKCEKSTRINLKKFNEEKYIEMEPMPGESFKDMVLRYRNGDNTIKITGV